MKFQILGLVALGLLPVIPAWAESLKITETIDGLPAGVIGSNVPANPAISADGRYVTFDARTANLVPGDTAGRLDVFVRDTVTGTTERVSVGMNGAEANGDSSSPTISGDGRYVAFESIATNLVPGDTNGVSDIFVFDRTAKRTLRASLSTDNVQANAACMRAHISGDGTHVGFLSSAGNLVSGDTNNRTDVFVRNLLTGETVRGTLNIDGTQRTHPRLGALSISSDGNRIAYDETIEGEVYLYDFDKHETSRASLPYDGTLASTGSNQSVISGNGRFVAFQGGASNLVPGDTGVTTDVFLFDSDAHRTIRVSVNTDGSERAASSTCASVSRDGRYAVFVSKTPPSTTLQLFVYDTQRGATASLASAVRENDDGGPSLGGPRMSADGQYITYASGVDIFRVVNALYEAPPQCDGETTPALTSAEVEEDLITSCGSWLDSCREGNTTCVKSTLNALLENGTLVSGLYDSYFESCLLAPPNYDDGFNAGVTSIDVEAIQTAAFSEGVASVDVNGIRSAAFAAGAESVDTKAFYDRGFADGMASIDVEAIKREAFAAGAASVDKDSIYKSGYAAGFEAGKNSMPACPTPIVCAIPTTCPTPPATLTKPQALSVLELSCPCAEAANHGAYVSCIAHALNGMTASGLISGDLRGELQASAAKSACGKASSSRKRIIRPKRSSRK